MAGANIHLASLVALTILMCVLGPAEAVNCPMNCKCSWVLDSLEADCSYSGLMYYPAFDSIPVEHLDLAGNSLVEFPTQYADIQTLGHLDLSNNDIEYIQVGDLEGFSKLRTLLLANNSFASWESLNPTVAFLPALSLSRLSLSGNKLESFNNMHPRWMLRSDSLARLELDGCGITSSQGDHINLALPNLEYLSLSQNLITDFGPMPSASLRELHVSNCRLTRISATLMTDMPALEVLDLSGNYALQFGGASPAEPLSSTSLVSLDLSLCNIDSIELGGFPNLRHANLHGNMLRRLDNSMFVNNTMLETLNLSHNGLRMVEAEAFAPMTRLVTVDMSYNEIAQLDPALFTENDALVSLNLSRNVIERFTRIVSNSLRDINLSWCEIIGIDSNAFTGLSAIQRLDLSNNLIRAIPNAMISATLQTLDLSNCRLTAIRNNTFREFPELASLRLNGNRFTNPFPTEFFKSNRFLDEIWIGDNPWICNCDDVNFMDFYDYLTAAPHKIRDKSNARCASPPAYYGKTWQSACMEVWIPRASTSTAEKVWSGIMLSILGLFALIFLISCFQRWRKRQANRRNNREYRRNRDEMLEIRRQNQRMLQEEGTPNAPSSYETNLPSYEDALRMPKPVRPVKSMLDLVRQRSLATENVDEEDADLVLDNKHRFRSEEMLSNRDKERTAQIGVHRPRVEYHASTSRCYVVDESRFPAAHFKSQNLQSAEKIGNFQSYENSPYCKRKAKIAEIPPFRRATLRADSVEFLTDPEYEEAQSKPGSPFARRKKTITPSRTPAYSEEPMYANISDLAPAVEDYFSKGKIKSVHSLASEDSDYQMLSKPEISSLRDSDTSDTDETKRLNERRRAEREAEVLKTNL